MEPVTKPKKKYEETANPRQKPPAQMPKIDDYIYPVVLRVYSYLDKFAWRDSPTGYSGLVAKIEPTVENLRKYTCDVTREDCYIALPVIIANLAASAGIVGVQYDKKLMIMENQAKKTIASIMLKYVDVLSISHVKSNASDADFRYQYVAALLNKILITEQICKDNQVIALNPKEIAEKFLYPIWCKCIDAEHCMVDCSDFIRDLSMIQGISDVFDFDFTSMLAEYNEMLKKVSEIDEHPYKKLPRLLELNLLYSSNQFANLITDIVADYPCDTPITRKIYTFIESVLSKQSTIDEANQSTLKKR